MAEKDESPAQPPEKPAQPDLPLDGDPSLEKVPDPEWYDSGLEPYPDDDRPLTTADFHNVAQKQILNAVFSVLSDTKMDWHLVAPFLDAARDVLLGDIEETAQVRLHNVHQVDGQWVEADEAYLGISVSDRDRGEEWLSDTYWLSEIVTADGDPEQVRANIRALERTIARLNLWLADKGGPVSPETPPA
jgi:hypothetical protein